MRTAAVTFPDTSRTPLLKRWRQDWRNRLHYGVLLNDTVSAATRVGIEARDEIKWLQRY